MIGLHQRKIMSGNIGLTKAGQALDKYILTIDEKRRRAITRFICAFTFLSRDIHQNNLSSHTKTTLFRLLRIDYLKKLDEQFSDLEDYPLNLARNYIVTLTKLDFTPVTKTQMNLLREKKESLNHKIEYE